MHGNREDCILFVVRGPSLCWRQISWCQTTQLLQNNVRYRLSKELYPQFSICIIISTFRKKTVFLSIKIYIIIVTKHINVLVCIPSSRQQIGFVCLRIVLRRSSWVFMMTSLEKTFRIYYNSILSMKICPCVFLNESRAILYFKCTNTL